MTLETDAMRRIMSWSGAPGRIRALVGVCGLLLGGPVLGTLAMADDPPPPRPAPGKDFEGRPFVTQKAPVLAFDAKRSAPRPHGIDYRLDEQTARGVALFARFPEFTLSDRRIHVSGPWYDREEDNGHFTHGITSIDALPRFRQGPTDLSKQPYTRKWSLMTDPMFWGYASKLADELEAANPSDPRIQGLRTFGVDHTITPDEPAFRALGHAVWAGESTSVDANGQGMKYPVIDIEVSKGWEHHRNSYGWIYQGLAEAAAADGVAVEPITYGQWTFSVGAVWESMRHNGDGDPEFLLPEKDYFAAPDPTLEAIEAQGGVLSMDGYLRAVWGKEPFYKRDARGRIVFQDGKPVYNDARKTTAYGIELDLEPGEAEHAMQDFYRQAVRMYLIHHRLAGEYPEQSDQRKSFLKRSRVGAWTRYTNEGLEGIEQNDRPLPAWQLETLVLMYLMTADDVVVWSSDFNAVPGPVGGDNSKTWKYNAHGVVEAVVKAAHRYSALEPLHQAPGPYRWCWFHLPMVNKNETDGERYDQKPIVFGKLRSFEGREWLELFAAWPALDGQEAAMQVWVEGDDGRKSPSYTIRLKDGRTSFYDAWALPAGFTDLKGRNIRLRFQDSEGKARTWTGDWRVTVPDTAPPPPPAARR